MGLFDDAVPGGNIATPIMIALGTLLVGKMMGGIGGGASAQAPGAPAAAPSGIPGGIPGGMGQPQQDGGLMGGLGGLLNRLTNAGHGDAVSSWVGSGANAPIHPEGLGTALGQTTVSDLAQRSGMSEQELLAQLARVLPGVVDKLTPNGRIPGDAEVRSAFG